ncbi:MAG TPA: substrate-binding domain-containing protein [Gemmatimonadales bacterium]|jgi:tungstate transport system substrate-binding protein|nr:substrate-binding domain-containing protein [Gemmatimonadales bacterium]
MRRHTLALALACAAQTACTRGTHAASLRLGTTTTVEQSGALALLDSLHPPTPVRVVVAASGTILRSAAAGDLDVVITHAPSLEQRLLVDPGRAALRCPFVASRFAVVGPANDPAHVAMAATAAEAFRRIADSRALFISRADSSGTHIKELSLWKAAGVTPGEGARNTWYVQAGVDQAATLRIADERAAYALADLPTFTRLADIALRVLFTADTALGNPYTLYVIRSASGDSDAARFSRWALLDWRSRLLAAPLAGGMAAFAPPPPPGDCTVPVAVTSPSGR